MAIRVKPHEIFQGDNADLLCTSPMQFHDSISGEKAQKHSPQAHNWLGGVKKFFEELRG